VNTIVGRDSLVRGDRPAAIAIGTFDGVHVGHRVLVARTLERAAADDMVATVLTWDRHPAATLRPDRKPLLLTTPERRIELIEELGVDQLVILEFDETLSKWSPETFARKVLAEGLDAGAVMVGRGWRFGHKATGDVAMLTELGGELGFAVEGLSLAEVGGEAVSSTRVREALEAGDVELVRALLGRPFDVDGVVGKGESRGTGLGWPTANLKVPDGFARPALGVYAGRGRVSDKWWPAAINVGVNPMFGGEVGRTPVRIEAYLLGYSGDLYGQTVRLEFHARLRDERKFGSEAELSEQIKRDVDATRRLV
jgi:riboflavin kinase / FMN adenylyltransferase